MNVTWVPDLNPGGGPAAGIWSGLSKCTSEYVFISAADQTLSVKRFGKLIAAALAMMGLGRFEVMAVDSHCVPAFALIYCGNCLRRPKA
jgi:molybdopterin-guanine dinucleotide biosynthesis protein A